MSLGTCVLCCLYVGVRVSVKKQYFGGKIERISKSKVGKKCLFCVGTVEENFDLNRILPEAQMWSISLLFFLLPLPLSATFSAAFFNYSPPQQAQIFRHSVLGRLSV